MPWWRPWGAKETRRSPRAENILAELEAIARTGTSVTSGHNTEVMHGKPVVEDKEYGRVLAHALRLAGLERIIRCSLLRFAEQNGG